MSDNKTTSDGDALKQQARAAEVKTLFDDHLLFVAEIPVYEQGFDSGFDHGRAAGERAAYLTVVEKLRAEIARYKTPRAQIASIEKNVIERLEAEATSPR